MRNWYVRVSLPLLISSLLPIAWLLLVITGFSGFMGSTPAWAIIPFILSLLVFMLLPLAAAFSMTQKLKRSLIIGTGTVVIGYLVGYKLTFDWGKLNTLLPFCFTCYQSVMMTDTTSAMVLFLLAASGRLKNMLSIVAMIVSIALAFLVSIIVEKSVFLTVIDGVRLANVISIYLLPSLMFSLSILFNMVVVENLSMKKALFFAVIVISFSVMFALFPVKAFLTVF